MRKTTIFLHNFHKFPIIYVHRLPNTLSFNSCDQTLQVYIVIEQLKGNFSVHFVGNSAAINPTARDKCLRVPGNSFHSLVNCDHMFSVPPENT